ncbi:hypothetical protein [Chamaesiphon sp. VAR_69_metabat_338]|uniref:hypothetical protein n=1 Tax=Chamaesiphon sp. VAR_69_metabat_338 TaxID=2964704 RepID=UPI00286E7ABC|nr:hypothetical protein [Chamaesiphon sp. VAR_69_metabat_338]
MASCNKRAAVAFFENATAASITIEMRSIFQPIVQVGDDVAQKTAIIATLDRVDLVLLGWHRPTFTITDGGVESPKCSPILLPT